MRLHHLQGVLSFYFAKVTKIIKVTDSIKSVFKNVYIRDRYGWWQNTIDKRLYAVPTLIITVHGSCVAVWLYIQYGLHCRCNPAVNWYKIRKVNEMWSERLNCAVCDGLILCGCFVYAGMIRTELGADIGTMWRFLLSYHLCGLFVVYAFERSPYDFYLKTLYDFLAGNYRFSVSVYLCKYYDHSSNFICSCFHWVIFSGKVFIWFRLYRVIHKSLRDFLTRLRNNQDTQGRKEHINS